MATLTKTVLAYGDPKVVMQSYSDTPNMKDGITIASFRIESTEYSNGDDVTIVLDGAKTIYHAVVKQLDGTQLALTEAATTDPVGMSVASGAITTAVDLYVFIVYNISTDD